MNAITSLTPRQLRKAADIQERILLLQEQLADLLGTPADSGIPPPTKKRKMSAAGRARIAAATKAKWAKFRATRQPATGSKKVKREMSAQAKAKLSKIAKARWKKARKQGKSTL
jgi:hypothetical protein